MIDLIFRVFSKARWDTLALNRGLVATNELGVTSPVPGVYIDELGPIVVTPAVYDENGVEITPAVMDTWHWVNLRLHSSFFESDRDTTAYPGDEAETYKFFRSKIARYVREQATMLVLRGVRVYQFGTNTNRVQLIDPRDWTAPVRIWVGGMEY